jgi:hypothetical protein
MTLTEINKEPVLHYEKHEFKNLFYNPHLQILLYNNIEKPWKIVKSSSLSRKTKTQKDYEYQMAMIPDKYGIKTRIHRTKFEKMMESGQLKEPKMVECEAGKSE